MHKAHFHYGDGEFCIVLNTTDLKPGIIIDICRGDKGKPESLLVTSVVSTGQNGDLNIGVIKRGTVVSQRTSLVMVARKERE